MFWLKKKCPMCNMKEEKGKGINENGKWFCNKEHLNQYQKGLKKDDKKHSCC